MADRGNFGFIINELMAQQNKEMQEFKDEVRYMINEKMKNESKQSVSSSLAIRIIFVAFTILTSMIGGITVYYVRENDEWKKTMRSDFDSLQRQVNDNTLTLKNGMTRIETIIESRFPEARKK